MLIIYTMFTQFKGTSNPSTQIGVGTIYSLSSKASNYDHSIPESKAHLIVSLGSREMIMHIIG